MDSQFLATLFGLNIQVLKVDLQGITHAESLFQPKPAGNCINWILGHMMATRDGALKLLGETPIWGPAETALYSRGSKPITEPGKALPLERLLADIDRSQDKLMNGLMRLSPKALAAPDPQGTLADKLAMLHFHEAYHVGQLGLLRRLVGREGAIH